MSRAKQLSEKIVADLHTAIDHALDDAIHLAFLQNPNVTEGEALKQARQDVVDMLKHYMDQLEK